MIYALDGIAPAIHPSAWIAPDAVVIGRVTIGANVGIWFGAVIRGDNEPIEIGAGTNVQENSVLHTDWGFPLTIGENCTIGHKAMLHGCRLGARTLVGMSATVLNGARIGEDCLVGAAALVTEGKVFEDGHLIMGSPAKAMRALDAAARARLLASAEGYQANARRFAAGLAPVR
jgi:carbonic anhydrase/acetyltransferase-like protein (isoleucine patch superfamily)